MENKSLVYHIECQTLTGLVSKLGYHSSKRKKLVAPCFESDVILVLLFDIVGVVAQSYKIKCFARNDACYSGIKL